MRRHLALLRSLPILGPFRFSGPSGEIDRFLVPGLTLDALLLCASSGAVCAWGPNGVGLVHGLSVRVAPEDGKEVVLRVSQDDDVQWGTDGESDVVSGCQFLLYNPSAPECPYRRFAIGLTYEGLVELKIEQPFAVLEDDENGEACDSMAPGDPEDEDEQLPLFELHGALP